MDRIIQAIQIQELPFSVKKETTDQINITLKKANSELKDKMITKLKQLGENTRTSVRDDRQKAVNLMKKIKSTDVQKRSIKELQEIVDDTSKQISTLSDKKENSIKAS